MWNKVWIGMVLALLATSGILPPTAAQGPNNTQENIDACDDWPFDERGEPRYQPCLRETQETRRDADNWALATAKDARPDLLP